MATQASTPVCLRLSQDGVTARLLHFDYGVLGAAVEPLDLGLGEDKRCLPDSSWAIAERLTRLGLCLWIPGRLFWRVKLILQSEVTLICALIQRLSFFIWNCIFGNSFIAIDLSYREAHQLRHLRRRCRAQIGLLFVALVDKLEV